MSEYYELVDDTDHRHGICVDAFEHLVADLLRRQGYWVQQSVKIDLTGEDKERIGRKSSPRWEIDIVAFDAVRGQLLALECKSYFDSGGVHAAHFKLGSKYAHRYKLFHEPVLRKVILERMKAQCTQQNLCNSGVQTGLGLVYGHATDFNRKQLEEIFETNEWRLFGPDWLCEKLEQLAGGSYENSLPAIVSKLLLRGNV